MQFIIFKHTLVAFTPYYIHDNVRYQWMTAAIMGSSEGSNNVNDNKTAATSKATVVSLGYPYSPTSPYPSSLTPPPPPTSQSTFTLPDRSVRSFNIFKASVAAPFYGSWRHHTPLLPTYPSEQFYLNLCRRECHTTAVYAS